MCKQRAQEAEDAQSRADLLSAQVILSGILGLYDKSVELALKNEGRRRAQTELRRPRDGEGVREQA